MSDVLTVVIATRSKWQSLRVTLCCLAVSRAPASGWQLVVVDDGSEDDTEDVLASFAGRLPLEVVAGPRRGRAAARNRGARSVSGGRLIFLDDDIVTEPGFLLAHASHHGPDTFVHGPLHEFPGARRWLDDHACDPVATLAGGGRDVVAGRGGRLLRNTLEEAVLAVAAGSLPAACGWLGGVGADLGVDAELFHELGGFDEGFGTGWGCEDLELGVRLQGAGARLVVDEGARGVHLTHARPGRWDEHDVNFARFLARHDRPEIRALPTLLGGRDGLLRYTAAVTPSLTATATP